MDVHAFHFFFFFELLLFSCPFLIDQRLVQRERPAQAQHYCVFELIQACCIMSVDFLKSHKLHSRNFVPPTLAGWCRHGSHRSQKNASQCFHVQGYKFPYLFSPPIFFSLIKSQPDSSPLVGKINAVGLAVSKCFN